MLKYLLLSFIFDIFAQYIININIKHMARFIIEEPGKPVKWVKDIDKANQAISFTTNEAEAYQRDGGFYPKAECEYIKHYFKEEYPELQYVHPDSDW